MSELDISDDAGISLQGSVRIELRELLFFLGLSLLFLMLLFSQRQLERRFAEHWHYAPKPVSVSLSGYGLTKSRHEGYYFWSSCWRQ